MAALVGPAEWNHDEMTDTHCDLVVASRAGVALGRLEGLNALDRGRDAADRIIFKA